MKILTWIIFLNILVVKGDTPAPVTQYITTSSNGKYCFVMAPPKFDLDKGVLFHKGKGVAYEVQKDGRLKEIWKTEGWYAYKVFISNDGKKLVRLGSKLLSEKVSSANLVVAFYIEGKEIKSFFQKDLLLPKNKTIIPSHSKSKLIDGLFSLKDEKGFKRNFKITPSKIEQLQ